MLRDGAHPVGNAEHVLEVIHAAGARGPALRGAVLREVAACAQARAPTKLAGGGMTSISELLPALEGWPEPPAPDAYYGLAGDIVGAIAPHTEAIWSPSSCSCWLRMVC